jgi:hypothetical protein
VLLLPFPLSRELGNPFRVLQLSGSQLLPVSIEPGAIGLQKAELGINFLLASGKVHVADIQVGNSREDFSFSHF